MKTCLRCKNTLPLIKFHSRTHTSKYTGKQAIHYTSYCKECNKVICKEQRNSRSGLFNLMYTGQVGSSKHRGHPPPSYTKEALIAWLEAQPLFQSLYDQWVSSGHSMKLKPSVDRIDESKPYSFDNIRLVTWRENELAHKHKMVTSGDQTCRPVNQYLDGVLIATHHSLHEAFRKTGASPGNILRCCRGEYETSKGYVWRYADEP